MEETMMETKPEVNDVPLPPAPVAPDKAPEVKPQPKVTQLITIGVDEEKKIYVNWPVDKKELAIVALAEAMKLVGTYQSNIVKPQPKFMDFIRGVKH